MQEQIQLTKQLAEPLSELQQTARHIAETSQECKLDLDPDEYVESFKPFSMDITYHWSKVWVACHVCMVMLDVTLVFHSLLSWVCLPVYLSVVTCKYGACTL
jgi:superfamily II RNA helicase